MKKHILILALFLLATPAWGRMPAYVLGAGGAISGCSGDPSATGSSGCLLRETFDGATACFSGFSSNCDNAWAYANGTDFANQDSPAPLQGTYSLSVPAGSANKAWLDFTAQGVVYVGTIITVSALPAIPIRLQSAVDSGTGCVLQLWDTSTLCILNAGGTTQCSTVTLAAGTPYYVMIKAEVGTGSNAKCTPYISTVAAKSWTALTASTDGTWTANMRYYSTIGETGVFKEDDIRVSTSSFNYW